MGFGRLELKFCGPDHCAALPAGEIADVSVTALFVQVMTPPTAVTTGIEASADTVAAAEVVQWFGPVTVARYTPGTVTVGLFWVELKFCGPVHSSVLPAGKKFADKVTCG